MKNFTYYTPTKVLFDENAENFAGEYLKSFGAKKVLLHYGSESAVKSGLLERVENSAKACGIETVKLGGVLPNPRLSLVYEGIKLCKEENIDFILAVGGGSVIDSTKAIALGVFNEGDVWDMFLGKTSPKGAMPFACVLTIAAAGSEMSDSCVISKEEGELKRSVGGECIICKFALMNPKLMLTLPKRQTVNGCVDILMHTMERYFNCCEVNLDITDRVAEAVLTSVMHNATILMENPNDIIARENIMWAGSLSHNSLTGCGTNGGDWATHNIEHELSGMFDVAHGAGLSSVWASWARFVVDIIPARFEKFAINVMKVSPKDSQKETALAGILAMENFFRSLESPVSLKELLGKEISDTEIVEMAEKATNHGKNTVGSTKPLTTEDIIAIYTAAK